MTIDMGEVFHRFFIVLTLPVALLMNWFINSDRGEKFAKRIPYKPRFINWLWAIWGGYFWLPCPICKKKFGGHEMSGQVLLTYGHGKGVCPKCIEKAKKQNEEFLSNFKGKEI